MSQNVNMFLNIFPAEPEEPSDLIGPEAPKTLASQDDKPLK